MNKALLLLILLLSILIGCNNDNDFETNNPTNPIKDCTPLEPLSDPTYEILNIRIGTWDGSTIISQSGEIITVGSRDIIGMTKMSLFVTDENGGLIREVDFNVPEKNSRALSLSEDSVGNLYVIGYSYNESWLENRILTIAKLSADKDLQWIRTYNEGEDITGSHIGILDNDIIVCTGERDGDLVFLTITDSGDEIVNKIIESESYASPAGMLITKDKDILITGSEDRQLHLASYNENAEIIWEKTYGPKSKAGRSTIELENGDLVTVGRITHLQGNTNIVESQNALILKTDKNGNLIWEKEIGTEEFSNDGQSIKKNINDGFVLTGYSIQCGYTDHFLYFINDEGESINMVNYNDFGAVRGQNILKLPDDRNIITGSFNGPSFFLNVDNFGM